ncbi:SdiA-regulated domain-containing protein [Leptolyngbya sp. FACHB-16]|uniref:SdiA-regulated domain-containing protein n=1 Tax=unclassified Leptolyngbya TaxID=2650499 RepID=UPI0016885160|nr:SdiA-regulated domain-containing protein [Leptolyngbya sp. FACHB-16]MBD2156858.1 SdiA-regulated domain-containing protein [Leptolyngbya sp. FACHB-16]
MAINFTGSYSQNFDTLTSSGASNLLPQDWVLLESGTNANGSYNAGTGSLNTGDTYSFGAPGSSERALGSLQSGSLNPSFGTSFTNNTDSLISSLTITFTGEQWRLGATGRSDRLDFQYSVDAASLASGTWVDVDSLDFSSLVTTGTVGALDENANSTLVTATITGLNIPVGSTFWFRWQDFNASGADDGLAIDNFSITTEVISEPTTPVVTIAAPDSTAAEASTNSGTFRISRTGDTTNSLTVNYSVGGTARTEDYSPSLTGTATLPAGQSFVDVSITPIDDAEIESNETITLTLIDTADYDLGATNSASVAIADNDGTPGAIRIRDIQGAAHISPLVGQTVSNVAGIVTAVATNGFYFQDPNSDADDQTSEGIFVFTNAAPTVAVGDSVLVNGTIAEFRPGNNANNLTITQITGPSITVLSSGNALPSAVVLGNGGRTIPTQTISNDFIISGGNVETGGDFDPANEGIDFYESVEGMRIQVNNAIATSPTANFGSSEEIWVLADNGENATSRASRGGSLISSSDFNPERIQIDDLINGTVTLPTMNVGAQLGQITGVVSYDFNNYEVLVSNAPAVLQPSTLQKEATNLTSSANQLTVATFNVENLDPGDGAAQFAAVAAAIVNNLRSPDIISLEEIQDNNGAINDGVVDANVTLQTLIDAVAAAGGPTYEFRQLNPVDDQDGGEPGGNIRVGFLFNPSRVGFVEGSLQRLTDPNPTESDSFAGDDFASSRKPLVGTFTFNGQQVTVIGNHFNSKGGDQPLFGPNQPPTLTSENQRNQQATIVRDYVQTLLAANPTANVIVAGDLNDFEFSNPLSILENGGLNTLVETLPANERYTYNFQGNAQVLDHILVSDNLLTNLDGFDVVHINSEFADQVSDHDPVVARFNLSDSNPAPTVDLSNYVRIGRYNLPEPTRTAASANNLLAQEVSAVTYNWDTDTLFVIGDGGRSIVQISKTGQLIDTMTLAAGSSPQGIEFYDTEGLTYVGEGRFVLVEERDRQASLFTYTPGTTLSRADVQTVKLGTTVGNIGLEGISYDPLTNGFIAVKENQTQGIFQTGIDFAAGTATNGSPTTTNSTDLFDPASLNLVDLADVYALSNLPALNGTATYNNLLVLSQESGRIVNVDRAGNISSSLTITSDPGNPLTIVDQGFEGVTMDRNALLYITSEEGGGDINNPQLWVYAPASYTYTNQAPNGISLATPTTTLSESTSTATPVKVGNIVISDDALGTNTLTLSGLDASFFAISGTELFLRAGTVLDFEAKTSYSINVNVNDPAIGNDLDATVPFTLTVTDIVEAPVSLVISEVAPWASGNSSIGADWFEVTNTGTSSVDITGWRMDDSSNAFATSVALNGITSIAPGESVIFLESAAPATVIDNFKTLWFGTNESTNLQIGTYTGSGVGLGTGGDAVNLFNAGGALQTSVTFGASPAGPSFPTFDNAAGLNNTTIAQFSAVGVNGAFVATGNANEIGSPGQIANPVVEQPFVLELLHFSDQEGGSRAIQDAPRLSAVLNALRSQDLGGDGLADNTLTLSSGDMYIPGLFFGASAGAFGSAGIGDIQIQNELGVQASALGNHEFDFGAQTLARLISGAAPGTILGADFAGTAFPYLSTNLNFAPNADLAPLEVAGGQAPQAGTVSSSVVINVNGENIGVVGATTPTLASISSSGTVGISPSPFAATPTPEQLDALAAEIQLEVDALRAADPTLDKIILLAHMQRIDIELALAERLRHVDIIVAGGSNTRLFDSNDRIRTGDSNQGQYPQFITNAGGTQTAVVNTDGNYKYVGRLVLEFDANGNIIPTSYDPDVSGAYATDAQGVADLNAGGLVDPEIQQIVDAIEAQILSTESNVFGISNVFLNGNRSGTSNPIDPDGVRTQETNLGNLTADANLAEAQAIDSTVLVSIKNGGGIRSSIGQTIVPAGGSAAVRLPNEAVVDSQGNVIKPEGGISQNDIQTALSFNNGLSLITLTKTELVALLEHGVSAVGAGSFPQIAGVKFSYDPDFAAGNRIQNAAIFDENDNLIAELVRDSEVVGDLNQLFRVVTLDFLLVPRFNADGSYASGGDGYPFPNLNTNPALGAVGDPAVIARANVVSLVQAGVRTGDATFANNGSEQDALAEYLFDNFRTTPYNEVDTGRDFDDRIQNLNFREDSIESAFNDAPVAVNDTASTTGSQSVVISVLANDTDPDAGDTLAIASFTNATNGVLVQNADNTFTYTPNSGFTGTDSFTYTVRDRGNLTSTATVTLTVTQASNQIIGTNGNDNLVGTNRADTILALAGNDTLKGGSGADRLVGGRGNDTYIVGAGDEVVEALDEGIDLVRSSISWVLADNVENLTLTGNRAIDGTGNNLANVLSGNNGRNQLTGLAGNDFLNGLGNNDTMVGGMGNDTYVINTAGDRTLENANEGSDLVLSSVTVALAAHVENLTLTGNANINGTGNAFDNRLTGNIDGNVLNSGSGNDVLIGGRGVDTLIGGSGNDTFAYNALNERGDRINDFSTTQDKLDLSALFDKLGYGGSNPIANGYLRFTRSGSTNLVQVDQNGLTGGANFRTLVTLNNVAPASLVVGSNVLI